MEKASALKILKQKMLADESLPLRKGANNLVFGEGNPEAKLMFIGEAPGYWEDIKGRPFVGNAGKFLDQLLHSIKVSREDVFITNIIFCRPPGNRDPQDKEIAAFKKYIDAIIEIVDPEIIATLGRFSMAKFLHGVTISKVHGKPHQISWRGKRKVVVPMFHPAAGLRRSEVRDQTMRDFQRLAKLLEVANKVNFEQMQLV
jgi:DNA polymerase